MSETENVKFNVVPGFPFGECCMLYAKATSRRSGATEGEEGWPQRTPVSPYLSPEEIAGMTRPLTQSAAQMKYLRKIGIRAERRPDGSVLVMREWLSERTPTEPKSPRPELQSVIAARRAQTTQTR